VHQLLPLPDELRLLRLAARRLRRCRCEKSRNDEKDSENYYDGRSHGRDYFTKLLVCRFGLGVDSREKGIQKAIWWTPERSNGARWPVGAGGWFGGNAGVFDHLAVPSGRQAEPVHAAGL